MVIASNEALTTTDYTSGLERRRMTVPFERRITEQAKQRLYFCLTGVTSFTGENEPPLTLTIYDGAVTMEESHYRQGYPMPGRGNIR